MSKAIVFTPDDTPRVGLQSDDVVLSATTSGHLRQRRVRHTTRRFTSRLLSMAFGTERPKIRLLITTTELKCNSVIEFTVTEVNHTTTDTALPGVPQPDMTLEGNTCTATDTTLLPFRIFTRRVFSVLILLWSVRSSAM